MKVANCRDRCK